ncbi:MAG: FKBP-type peptidyl-prolyl cis-trans isomerase [Planctomycetota bacterium]|jgi:peptidylprolyl isomerase
MIDSGKTVKVHYKGMLDDGSVFDTSQGREPLEFQAGQGQVIPGFDAAILEMDAGATKTVKIPCSDAYGEPREDMIATIPHDRFPPDLKPEVGQTLQFNSPAGPMAVVVVEVVDEGVTIDGNHPLEDKDLTFELTVVEVS